MRTRNPILKHNYVSVLLVGLNMLLVVLTWWRPRARMPWQAMPPGPTREPCMRHMTATCQAW